MTPYYDVDGITIYHGDCLEVLDNLALTDVDLVFTSPPYNLGVTTGGGFAADGRKTGKWSGGPLRDGYGAHDDAMPYSEYVAWQQTVLTLHYGPVVVDALFVFPRPKAHYRTGRHAGELKDSAPYWCSTNPDGDKCARAVGDALSGVLLRDDNLIVEWRIRKVYGDPARAEIRITPALDRPSGAAKEEPE